MGLFSNIGDAIWGSPGGIPNWLQDYMKGSFGQWNTARQQMYSPEAQRRKVASWGENFDRTLETQNAAIGRNLNKRGFSGNSGGNYLPATRARGMAEQRSNVADWADQGMMNSIVPPWLSQVIQALYKQPSGGLMGSVGPAMGQAAAMAAMGAAPDVKRPNDPDPGQDIYNLYGQMTPTAGTTPYNYGENGTYYDPMGKRYYP